MPIDPMSMMAAGSSAVGAGTQLLGGFFGGAGYSSGDQINPYWNPNLDTALQASNFDLLSQIGFGNIQNTVDPFEQLVGRINALPMEERDKRRALTGLTALRKRYAAGDMDPFAKARQGLKRGRLEKVIGKLGMTLADLPKIQQDQLRQEQQMQKLREAGLDGMQNDIILNRAKTAQTAAQLMGGAAGFARDGQPSAGIGTDLFNRDERQLGDLQSRLGIMANFGGINPATMFEQLTDAKLDQNLRLIEQQLGMSNAFSASLSPGSQSGSQAAAQSNSASMNSAQIAAQQAQAANSLRQQAAESQATSLANGIGAAGSSLASGFGNAALLNQMGRQNDLFERQLGMGGSSMGLNFGGPSTGLNFGKVASQFAVPGVYNGGRP